MLFATSGLHETWQILAGLCTVGSVFLFTLTVLNIVYRSLYCPVSRFDQSYDDKQIERIRKSHPVFRYAESFVDELVVFVERSPRLHLVEHHLAIMNLSPPWTARLYMATKVLEGLLFGFLTGLFSCIFLPFFMAIGLASLIVFVYYQISLANLKSMAEKRKSDIKLRLPFVVDLMALTRGAGASFGESLTVAAKENDDHPAGEIFARALHDFSFGSDPKTVMEELSNRMQDADFQEMTFAVNKAEELGTPIAKTLAELAIQMRLKRQQWGEKSSNEAEVKILFPGVIIMIACMLIIIFPFILMAIYGNVAL